MKLNRSYECVRRKSGSFCLVICHVPRIFAKSRISILYISWIDSTLINYQLRPVVGFTRIDLWLMRSDAVKSTHLTSTGLNNNSTLIFYMEFPHRLRSVMIGVMHVHPTRTSIILRHECQVPLGLRRTRSNLPIWNDSRCLLFLWHLILTRLLPDRFFNGIMPRQVKEQISPASENRKGINTWVYTFHITSGSRLLLSSRFMYLRGRLLPGFLICDHGSRYMVHLSLLTWGLTSCEWPCKIVMQTLVGEASNRLAQSASPISWRLSQFMLRKYHVHATAPWNVRISAITFPAGPQHGYSVIFCLLTCWGKIFQSQHEGMI